MKSLAKTLFLLICLSGLAYGNTPREKLEALKDDAKNLLYSDPDEAMSLFKALKKKCQSFFAEELITKKEREEILGDVASGMGNFHLIATGNVDSAFYYYDVSITHYQTAKDMMGVGSILNNKGVVLEQLSLQDSALMFYDSALYYYEAEKDLRKMSKTYGNIGNIYIDKGNYPMAQAYYLKSYDCAAEVQDTLELAYTYFGLGNIAKFTKNIHEAESYYQKALDGFKTTDDLFGLSSAYFCMANVYKEQLKIDSAYYLYHQTLSSFAKAGYTSSLPQCHINIAVLFNEYYDSLENFPQSFQSTKAEELVKLIKNSGLDSAKYHSNEAIKISKLVSKNYTLVFGYIAYGTTEILLKNYNNALLYGDSAYHFIKMGSFVNEMKQLGHLRYNAYKGLGDHQKALQWYETYVNLKDSLYNLDKAEELIQQKYQFDFDKKITEDSLLHEAEMKKNLALEQAKTAQQKTRNFYLSIIAVVLLALGIVIFQRLKVTQKQKKIIDDQKKEVEAQKNQIELQHLQLEETHKEISDSIRYAQRLQAAILPEMDDLNTALKDGFVLFKPKDVVSGDFYWMQTIPDGVLFAAADCTGHGVPGAMVSVVCSNALNRAVKEFGLHEPSEILNKTRDLVIETFESTSTDVKDGMDIALCKLCYTDSGAEVTFAGANNPLWILREHAEEIEEVKGAKQPIGKYEDHTPFPQHRVTLNRQDCIFVFSDGYADQFGGEKGKKMKLRPFKNVLAQMHGLSMDDRKNNLEQVFEEWKGNFEQVDDVTVIGIRIC